MILQEYLSNETHLQSFKGRNKIFYILMYTYMFLLKL